MYLLKRKVAGSKEGEIDVVLYCSDTESIPKRLTTTTTKLTYCENNKGNCTQDFSDMKTVVRFSGLGCHCHFHLDSSPGSPALEEAG